MKVNLKLLFVTLKYLQRFTPQLMLSLRKKKKKTISCNPHSRALSKIDENKKTLLKESHKPCIYNKHGRRGSGQRELKFNYKQSTMVVWGETLFFWREKIAG